MDEKAVVLIEDNPDDAFLTMRTLKKCGITKVTLLHDGVEALDFLLGRRDDGHRPDPAPTFILLDLKLPKVDGIEVLEALHADPRARLIPVIVLSSSREDSDLRRCLALGARDYLNKPLNAGELCAIIDRLPEPYQI